MLSINPLQRRVLTMLAKIDYATTVDVSHELNTTKQTARNQLRSLIDKKYAERVPGPELPDSAPPYEHTRITPRGREALTYDFVAKKDLQQTLPRSATVIEYDKYTPPTMQSVRPGADDHLQFKSRGV